jgi:hypothetical protein
MTTLTVQRPADVDAFLAAAGDFLGRREAEHNLPLGICSGLKAAPGAYGDDTPQFLVVTGAGGAVVAASLRTPPFNQVLSLADDPAAVDLVADALRGAPLPGVVGPAAEARRFAERWSAQNGAAARLEVAERVFSIERVTPPARPASGAWRLVDARDRDLVAQWVVAFSAEAMPGNPPILDPLAMADRWVARVGRIGYVWEDGGRVVSLVGASGETPNGIRIGPVYTPPEFRGRGYATSLTAAATSDLLDRGRRFVFLFTDLANPTSNKIYQEIGYQPVCDVDQWTFGAR